MTTPPRTPTTAACPHDVIETWGDGATAVMWACANPDCRLRFYPACRECVDVGHRNIVHEARASLEAEIERLRRIETAARLINRHVGASERAHENGDGCWASFESALGEPTE